MTAHKGCGFKTKGEVNSPKVEPPMNSKEKYAKKVISNQKPRYVSIDGGPPVRFRL